MDKDSYVIFITLMFLLSLMLNMALFGTKITEAEHYGKCQGELSTGSVSV
jgi:hypothetical protein